MRMLEKWVARRNQADNDTKQYSKFVKRIELIAMAAAVLLCFGGTSWAAIDLHYTSAKNADINFANGSFSFSPAVTSGTPRPVDFTITTSTGVGDSIGDTGFITGSYTIGTPDPDGTGYSVTGTGTFNILDNKGKLLTGTIAWVDLASLGTSGDVNVEGVLNLTTITYSGKQQDLLALAAGRVASDSISFVLPHTHPVTTAATLAAGQKASLAYNGNIYSSVPEPSTLFAGALLVLPFAASTLRVLRKNRGA